MSERTSTFWDYYRRVVGQFWADISGHLWLTVITVIGTILGAILGVKYHLLKVDQTGATVGINTLPSILVLVAYVFYHAVRAPWQIHQALQLELGNRPKVNVTINWASFHRGIETTGGGVTEQIVVIRLGASIVNIATKATVSDYRLSLITSSETLEATRVDTVGLQPPIPISHFEHLPIPKDYPDIERDLLLEQNHGVSRSLALYFTQRGIKGERGVRYDDAAILRLIIVDSFGKEWKTERHATGLSREGGPVAFR